MNTGFLPRTGPRPSFEPPESEDYTIKFSKSINARLQSSIQTEYNDNISLSESDPQSDLYVIPSARLGFVWHVNDTQMMQFSLGAGYELHLNAPALSTFTIDPDSRIDHRISIGKVQVTLSDAFSVQADPTARGEISGNRELINFRRLRNSSGVHANWQARSNLNLVGGYDFLLDQSMSGQFQTLDHHDHSLNAGLSFALSPRNIVGLAADYTMTEYDQKVQNDGVRYTVGPNWIYNLTQFITLTAGVGYTIATFDRTGTITDTSNFEGLSYQASVRHRFNRRMSHEIQITKSTGLGLDSNFTEILAAQYTINTQLGPHLFVNSTVSYEHLEVSGVAGETADRFLVYTGTGLRLTKHWTAGIGYAMSFKDSNQPDRDYVQNRFTLDLSRHF